MKIGKLDLTAAAPDAERLLATTGLSPAEMRRQLEGYPIAGTVARALNACLAEPIDEGELAAAIAIEGVNKVRIKVLAIYDAAEKKAADGKVKK